MGKRYRGSLQAVSGCNYIALGQRRSCRALATLLQLSQEAASLLIPCFEMSVMKKKKKSRFLASRSLRNDSARSMHSES